jgi:integrase
VDQLKSLKPIDPNKHKEMCTVVGEDGKPWIEALQFLIHNSHKKPATVLSKAKDLAHYLSFLEEEGISWLHFPKRKSDRCVYRYRAYLDDPSRVSTTKQTEQRRIRTIVSFYRWAIHEGFIDKEIETWTEQNIFIGFDDKVGFKRRMSVNTTDLRIRSGKRNKRTLEDGLMPLHPDDRDALIEYLKNSPSSVDQMLWHIHALGFWSGARSRTIRDIGVTNLELAKKAHPQDPSEPYLVYLAVGPGTGVRTKFNKSGDLRIPKAVFDQLYEYAYSAERKIREGKANEKGNDGNILFLSKHGDPISDRSFTALMSQLRERLFKAGLKQFHDFTFHQTRATCGTEIAAIYLSIDPESAVMEVMLWLMHNEESTAWTYINFVNRSKQIKKDSGGFIEQFLGPTFASRAVSDD